MVNHQASHREPPNRRQPTAADSQRQPTTVANRRRSPTDDNRRQPTANGSRRRSPTDDSRQPTAADDGRRPTLPVNQKSGTDVRGPQCVLLTTKTPMGAMVRCIQSIYAYLRHGRSFTGAHKNYSCQNFLWTKKYYNNVSPKIFCHAGLPCAPPAPCLRLVERGRAEKAEVITSATP
jgi:hypothetical protein